ncbi:hypothetical protein NQT69_03040 [Pseudoalteromonas shioyasakiensis]|uniref:hypothetical protein n=1 Tax=Pseudoalteromonas shioyasakiensis TaxID=1190813 RepID=UPI00211921EE|nr:hypothetical protein [Pseudoalteromonas shioyasakiensis]MCQ8877012.1 hypothetical protein [Pseudoalteromonas shioyasakiensis]
MAKNNRLTMYLSALCIMFSGASVADECTLAEQSTTDDTKKYIQCLDKDIAALERSQQTWINKLTLDLAKIQEDTGNTQLLPIFKRSIKSQTRFLEDSCRWRYLQKMPNATQAAIVYKRCEIRVLQQHLEVLKQPLK